MHGTTNIKFKAYWITLMPKTTQKMSLKDYIKECIESESDEIQFNKNKS